jgi:endonuclease VIII
MAEGDTVHRLAKRLEVPLAGQRVVRAEAPAPRSPLRLQRRRLAELEGRRVEGAEARGKHLLLHLDEGVALHSRLGMRGSWRVFAPAERWRGPSREAWLVISTRARVAVQFGGSALAIRTETELRSDPLLKELGPDILAGEFASEHGLAGLRAADGSRELGDALLDQRVIAWIGNVYKNEGCHAAGLSPWRRLDDLADAELVRVLAETRALMAATVEGERIPRMIYRRAGRPCPRCGTWIRSRGQSDANRMTYWCPGCQVDGGAR